MNKKRLALIILGIGLLVIFFVPWANVESALPECDKYCYAHNVYIK